MTLISLAMIVKNEEATLAHCLESVRLLVDEIIIVDTGSTDRTVEIAKEFGARIHYFKWCDDFAAARNESLKYVKGEWVLILDADEAIDWLDHDRIKNACLNPFADAYELTTRNYMHSSVVSTHDIASVPNKSHYSEGKGLPFYSDSTGLRLARFFDGLAFSGRIHETMGDPLLSRGKTFKRLDAVIHHFGKLFNERAEHKARYYLSLAQQEVERNPDDMTAQFNLLQQALVAMQWDVALRAAEASLKRGQPVHPLVFYGGGVSLQLMGRHAEAIAYFDRLLEIAPEHILAVLSKAYSCEMTGNADMGRTLIRQAIELQPDYVRAYGCLAELELRANNLDIARKITLDSLEVSPHEPAMYHLLIKIEAARGNHQQVAKDALLALQRCPTGGEGKWHRLAAAWLAQIGELGTARGIVELGLKVFPNDPDLARLKGMI